MFRRLAQRFKDMRTISQLCRSAEQFANAEGQQQPGTEHFVLAALALPDGAARRSFVRIGADPDRFGGAIAQQHADALASIGIQAPPATDSDAVGPGAGVYRAKQQVGELMQRLMDARRRTPDIPLCSAHVIAAVLGSQQGVAPRALRSMGVDAGALADAVQAELSQAM